MKVKIQVVERCNDCRFFIPWSNCEHPKCPKGKQSALKISEFGKIPKWCPLQDGEAGND